MIVDPGQFYFGELHHQRVSFQSALTRKEHLMTDYGEITAPDTVRIERRLPGPIQRLWAYLTESDKRRLWLASGEMALQPGGGVTLVFRNTKLTGHDGSPPPKYAHHPEESQLNGTVIDCDPPRLLRYRWGVSPDASEVCFELTEQGADVLLVVTHTRLPTRDEMLSVAAGWHTHLEILTARLTDQAPPGFWPLHTQLEAGYETRIPLPTAN